ncbi:hypothetical protein C2S52_011704 [Perilla frutescens var. hirtella]|nr:hypothetical protein C2S52_011704 [Perilla frutescens var. hirtella]
MPSKLKKAIAAVKDQTSISLARYSKKDSSNLEVVVLKATSHEDVPIDDKYVHEVLRLVSANKVHAAACARAIGKRIGRTRNWVVALKSLMLVLRIFQDGDPYFPREVLHAMKRGAKILNLSSFRDDSNSSPWDFTSFVRTFALYLDERLECFLTGKLQRRQIQEDSTSMYQRSRSNRAIRPNEPVKDMKPAMLLDKMSYWQRLLDRAIATRPTGAAKTNRLVHVALYAILQESFDLYKDISEGLSLILDSFFHLQYQNCVIAFQTCIKAVKQFEELSAFFTQCKSLGVGRISEYPSVQAISEELIESLQEFLKDQSSFQSNVVAKPVVNQITAPKPPLIVRTRSSRNESYGAQSDFSVTTDGYSDEASEMGSQSTSLEELISAAGTWKSPAISIDLETYLSSKPDDAFGVSDTGSSRSLPATRSNGDLMSVDDWPSSSDDDDDQDQDQDHQQQEEKRKGKMSSVVSKNWETVLAETLSSSSSPLPLTDHNTNTFYAFPEISLAETDNPSAVANTAMNRWDLVMFEAPPVTPPELKTPDDHPYNPFLVNFMESPGASNQQSAALTPTFQATPTFSAQNPSVSSFEDDPFASGAEFSGDQVLSDAVDQQNLLQQQELWLQNQNKILAKNCS